MQTTSVLESVCLSKIKIHNFQKRYIDFLWWTLTLKKSKDFQYFSGLWVGWPGMYLGDDEIIPESDPSDSTPTAGLKSNQVVPVNLNAEDYELYYNGCCNATFWPLFHSMPDR